LSSSAHSADLVSLASNWLLGLLVKWLSGSSLLANTQSRWSTFYLLVFKLLPSLSVSLSHRLSCKTSLLISLTWY
jgi:hypothetical protein